MKKFLTCRQRKINLEFVYCSTTEHAIAYNYRQFRLYNCYNRRCNGHKIIIIPCCKKLSAIVVLSPSTYRGYVRQILCKMQFCSNIQSAKAVIFFLRPSVVFLFISTSIVNPFSLTWLIKTNLFVRKMGDQFVIRITSLKSTIKRCGRSGLDSIA